MNDSSIQVDDPLAASAGLKPSSPGCDGAVGVHAAPSAASACAELGSIVAGAETHPEETFTAVAPARRDGAATGTGQQPHASAAAELPTDSHVATETVGAATGSRANGERPRRACRDAASNVATPSFNDSQSDHSSPESLRSNDPSYKQRSEEDEDSVSEDPRPPRVNQVKKTKKRASDQLRGSEENKKVKCRKDPEDPGSVPPAMPGSDEDAFSVYRPFSDPVPLPSNSVRVFESGVSTLFLVVVVSLAENSVLIRTIGVCYYSC